LDSATAQEIETPTDIVRVRRRQVRSIDTRAKIIKAAIKVFADSGFEGASTRQIAELAGIRHALVIYHFDTKLGIWQAVMQDVLGGFHDAFVRRLEGLDGVDDVTKLKLLKADFIRMSAQRPELHWLMSHEAGQSDRTSWLVENLLGNTTGIFRELIASAQASGRYVSGDSTHLFYIFLGAAVRIFMVAGEVERISGRSPFAPDYVEEHIQLCERLFFIDPE
jgi:TetR/AcrR family transcriptional regulator